MSLPKIKHPLFELVVPSTGEKIKYRPFTVREEKIMLIAQETKDVEQAVLSIKQILTNCLVDCDIEKFAMFDFEYILLMLRSKSVDNLVKFVIKDPDTKEEVTIELDLDHVEIIRQDGHSNRIQVNEELTLFMRYPTMNEFLMLVKGGANNAETHYNILLSCMERVATADEVYEFSSFTDEEIAEFVDDMTGEMRKSLENFFETMPKLRHEIKYKNSKGDEKTFVIEGIETFFI